MNKLTGLRLMLNNWDLTKDLTKEEQLDYFKLLFSEIDRLQGIVNIVNAAVSGEYKDIESNESTQPKAEAE